MVDFQILSKDKEKIEKIVNLIRVIVRMFYKEIDIVVMDFLLRIYFEEFYIDKVDIQ